MLNVVRADLLLVSRGLAPSRSAAQRLIDRGAVRWRAASGWALPRKAGDELPEGCEIEVTDDAELRWVSRAGLKLDAALAHAGIAVQGLDCLDVGQSTGGFTDVLLARGAARVVGVDVGLAPGMLPLPRYGLVVADLSFISLTLVLPAIAALASRDLLLLVKPQFELQPADIGRGGLVTDPAAHARVEQRIRTACADAGLAVIDYFPSAIAGGDGNREFFIRAQR